MEHWRFGQGHRLWMSPFDALLGKSLGIADQQQSKPSHKNKCWKSNLQALSWVLIHDCPKSLFTVAVCSYLKEVFQCKTFWNI